MDLLDWGMLDTFVPYNKVKDLYMSRKEEYKQKNLEYLEKISTGEGVLGLPCGILYKVIQVGSGMVSPTGGSVVSVHYRGTLINGREFDNSWKRGCPEAFRLNQVIEGWQQGLQYMKVGDRWMIYIPYQLGYGNRTSGPIPAFSTLIFEVELLSIA